MSLVPWVAGLLTPRMAVTCGDTWSCVFASMGAAAVDLVFAVLFPLVLTLAFVPVLSWLSLHLMRVEAAGVITTVAVLLVLTSWLVARPAVPSVAATIMWAVCYLVAEVSVSWIRARRARSG
ncbi:hypothetical protein SAMN05661093_02730 [Kibdelosporangium aridum]|uniref:Uncharacterized protein n=2 Tax=Kibdelosporangium aridum TaxID=2030 RepID=A0A1W2D0T6_KIBAR|nr:hypothetical protein SAMN05661093_02730 [Kibdelosporangium aridum]